jgi:hypothetical protein
MNNPVMEALMLARANDRLVALKHEEAPRSWSREAKLAFLHLPPEVQVYYVAREKARDREVRNAQNDRAVALQELAEMQAECAKLEIRIAELENANVCEAGDDPIAAEPSKTGNTDGPAEIKNTAAA